MRRRILNFKWLGSNKWNGIQGISTIMALPLTIAALISLITLIVLHLFPTLGGSPQISSPSPKGATTTPILSPTTTPMPSPTPASATDWGTLSGDSITIKKPLSCGDGCPDPVIVTITAIQINRPSEMTWDLSLTAPTGTPSNGFTEASFPQFTLSSDVTPLYQVNPESITAGNFQAKFPFVPVSNHIYTLAVTVSYHTLNGGIVSIQAQSVTFEPVTMLFQP